MFRTAYDRENHERRGHAPSDRGKRAKQSFRDECNVNSIVKRFEKTGIVTHGNPREGQFLDCGSAPDFQRALNTVIAVQEHFNSLSAECRKRFSNDPVGFVEFMADDKNADEIERLGLMSDEAVEARRKARKAAAEKKYAAEVAAAAKAAQAASEGE